MSESLTQLHPALQPAARYLLAQAVARGGQLTSVRRSYQKQSELWQAYLRGATKYPAAPPGTSKHEYGLAFDIIAPTPVLNALGALWERMGGRWGGRFGDPIHFEA